MRISTSQIYNSGVIAIQDNQQSLYKLQNQLSSGKRVLTPSDDPVAASQALVVSQAQNLNTEYATNQGTAQSQLGIVSNSLTSLANLVQTVRQTAVGSMNASYSDSQRKSLATNLQQQLDALIGIANSTDGNGQYLYSGYQGNTKPFAINGAAAAVPPATVAPVAYYGDSGQRLVQVDAGRQMQVNVSGAQLFMGIPNGNGSFATATAGNAGGGNNQGTGMIDAGSVSNPASWTSAVNTYGALKIQFSSSGGNLQYQIYDSTNTALLAAPANYTPGQAIALQKTTAPAADFGAQVVISGTPAAGDQFSVTPSTSQSVFQTLQNLIGTLQTPETATFTSTELSNRVSAEITNLDQALNTINSATADVGSRQSQLNDLSTNNTNQKTQYAKTLSSLQDLDYTAAISSFTQQQTQLQAAEKSFVQISGLSLFSLL